MGIIGGNFGLSQTKFFLRQHLKQEKLDPLKANNSGILGQTYSEDLQAVWVKETSFMRQTGDPRPTEGLIQ